MKNHEQLESCDREHNRNDQMKSDSFHDISCPWYEISQWSLTHDSVFFKEPSKPLVYKSFKQFIDLGLGVGLGLVLGLGLGIGLVRARVD